ncbi:MAG: hypothetical protein KatS3mg109_1238 [Pirellulaceae bacterium]|nr:MAG: hypothetical protein KatS3mg109_1238 [Pirellulaceae bacterium]
MVSVAVAGGRSATFPAGHTKGGDLHDDCDVIPSNRNRLPHKGVLVLEVTRCMHVPVRMTG